MTERRFPYKSRREWLYHRVDHDLQTGDLTKAICRLEGAIECHPLDEPLNRRLAELYLMNQDQTKAGRHFYLCSDLRDPESEAVERFKKSLGNDPILILKKLITFLFFRVRELDDSKILKLDQLLSEIRSTQTMPKFLQPIDRHVNKRLRSENQLLGK